MRSISNKKGAIELSIGTIVVLVLAMSMLILGLVLVRNIFQGATYNVDTLNKNVEAEINKLFNDKGQKTVIYLPDNQADVKKGESFGIAFGIKNTAEGESGASAFSYDITASSVQTGCQLSLAQADSYVSLGKSASGISLVPGSDPAYRIAKVTPPDTAPLCEIIYDIKVKKSGQPYDTNFFIVKIIGQ